MDKLPKKPRVVYVDKPVFKVQDPNDPIHYVLRNQNTPIESDMPEQEAEQLDQRDLASSNASSNKVLKLKEFMGQDHLMREAEINPESKAAQQAPRLNPTTIDSLGDIETGNLSVNQVDEIFKNAKAQAPEEDRGLLRMYEEEYRSTGPKPEFTNLRRLLRGGR